MDQQSSGSEVRASCFVAPACRGVGLEMKPVEERGGPSGHPGGAGQAVKSHWPGSSHQGNLSSKRNVFWPEPCEMVSVVSSSGVICVVR